MTEPSLPPSFPHLFIIGAQKSGTTSLAEWLDAQAGVALSRPKEPMILSRDEIDIHPHFFAREPEQWDGFNWQQNRAAIDEEYQRCFAHAAAGDIWAEGSTSYLPSKRAAARIREVNPEAKIIVLLRDPTLRTYSAYWHQLRYGAATHGFEAYLQYEGQSALHASLYVPQIQHWLAHFPRKQCLFLLYEQLVQAQKESLEKVADFLSLSGVTSFDLPAANQSLAPRSARLQMLMNHLYRHVGSTFSSASYGKNSAESLLQKAVHSIEAWNWQAGKPPALPSVLHQRLDHFFHEANKELPSLTGLDVAPYWYRSLA